MKTKPNLARFERAYKRAIVNRNLAQASKIAMIAITLMTAQR